MVKHDPMALLSDTLRYVFSSPNQVDPNFETANVVDGLYAFAGAVHHLAHAFEAYVAARKEEEHEHL